MTTQGRFHCTQYVILNSLHINDNDNDNDNEIILFGHREKTVKC